MKNNHAPTSLKDYCESGRTSARRIQEGIGLGSVLTSSQLLKRHQSKADLDRLVNLSHEKRIECSESLHDPVAIHRADLAELNGRLHGKAVRFRSGYGDIHGIGDRRELRGDGGDDRYRAVPVADVVLDD